MGAPTEDTAVSRESLRERWRAMLNDPVLTSLPYKIELNHWGRIEMSPLAGPRHMNVGALLAKAMRERLNGRAFQECSILTPQGVLGADVVWCSPEFVARHSAAFKGEEGLMDEAPEICIEVKSPSNSVAELKEKIDAYLAAGAVEAWIVSEDLQVRFFDRDGEREATRFDVDLEAWRAEVG